MTDKSEFIETDLADQAIHGDPDPNFLYERKDSYIPRIAAVHDLCGYGKCSLSVAIPVLSAAGCDVCSVPTGLFSSHTGYANFYMHDTTEMLRGYLDAWKSIGVGIDAVYSGFLGAPEQVDIIRELYSLYPGAIRMVDPVMADHGKIYPTYTPELCEAMVDLAKDADVLTPNLTEAAIILGEPIGDDWQGCDITDEVAQDKVRRLLDLGAKSVVLKGIQRAGENVIRNFVGSKNMDEIIEVKNNYIPYMLHGTGDVYASCVLAAIMAGRSVVEGVAFAGSFIEDAMVLSTKQPDFEQRGVSFELLLGRVAQLLNQTV